MAVQRPCGKLLLAFAGLSRSWATVAEPSEAGWSVSCSRRCHGRDLCQEVCRGEHVQTHACPDLEPCEGEEVRRCRDDQEPEHCQLGDWSDWTPKDCTGLCARKRHILKPNVCGGLPCEGRLGETKRCETRCESKKDCVFADWSDWSSCNATAVFQRERSRDIATASAGGGAECLGSLLETEVCGALGQRGAQSSECQLSEWVPWTQCSRTCGGGQQTRFRTIEPQAKGAAALPCEATLSEVQGCGAAPCYQDMQDCKLSSWSEWGACDGSSKERASQKLRTRIVMDEATSGGTVCEGPLEELAPCDEAAQEAPVDCKLAPWSEWIACDKACGGGQTYRSRRVDRSSRYGGKGCEGVLKETKACNEHHCRHVDGRPCVLSSWSDWSSCSRTCGAGQERRSRQVLQQAQNGGEGCEEATAEARGCEDTPACVFEDCELAAWSQWSECPVTCGGGLQRRSREVRAPGLGGRPCKVHSRDEVRSCAQSSCQQHDCQNGRWASWGGWSKCSRTCEGGYRFRSRRVDRPATKCGAPLIGKALETERCSSDVPCDDSADCKLSHWSSWSACSDQCEGIRTRHRSIEVLGRGNGVPCEEALSLGQIESCHGATDDDRCFHWPRHCILGPWAEWSACAGDGHSGSSQCGGGQRTRHRQVRTAARNGGLQCEGPLEELAPCQGRTTCVGRVDCRWGQWSDWGHCTKSCGGKRHRQRSIAEVPSNGGSECEAASSQEIEWCAPCSVQKPRYCVLEDWSPFGTCSTSCGSATKERRRAFKVLDTPPDVGVFRVVDEEEDCRDPPEVEQQVCEDNDACAPCEPQACVLNAWSDWSEPTCEGLCRRLRAVNAEYSFRESCTCVGSDAILEETKKCEASCGKRDCKLSEWSPWSPCAAGQRYRFRKVDVEPSFDGEACTGELRIAAPCGSDNRQIPHDCELGPWDAWGDCDKTCGGGHRSRSRKVEREAGPNGLGCSGAMSMMESCSTHECPATDANSCRWSDWSKWSSCRGEEDQQVYRRRQVEVFAKGPFGKACEGPMNQTKQCPVITLPEPCKFGEWTRWADCDKSCGGGYQGRSRKIAQEAVSGAEPCKGSLKEMRACNQQACVERRDCLFVGWSEWSDCSKSCGAGTQSRDRRVDKPAQAGGSPCLGMLKEVRQCFEHRLDDCPHVQDCKWAEWSSWGTCVQAEGSCGIGFKVRHRDILVPPSYGGEVCAPRSMQEIAPVQDCQGQPACCVDGRWADWGDWTRCSASCADGQRAKGTRQRTREQLVKETWCGKPPPGFGKELEPCVAESCGRRQDCKFGPWSNMSACSAECNGHRKMTRDIQAESIDGGEACEGEVEVLSRCNPATGEDPPRACGHIQVGERIDCEMENWSEWTVCTATCAVGRRSRQRSVKELPMNGGEACSSSLKEVEPCHAGVQCFEEPVDCQWGAWMPWSLCNASSSEKTRLRGFAVLEASGGSPCAGDMKEVASCGDICQAPREYTCAWQPWGDWSQCSKTCGTEATRSRTRLLQVVVPEPPPIPPTPMPPPPMQGDFSSATAAAPPSAVSGHSDDLGDDASAAARMSDLQHWADSLHATHANVQEDIAEASYGSSVASKPLRQWQQQQPEPKARQPRSPAVEQPVREGGDQEGILPTRLPSGSQRQKPSEGRSALPEDVCRTCSCMNPCRSSTRRSW
eukprot:TRINITY_DN11019_c0_g1_i2.p1 TRINITY_DN11019_c0_g1~~TRINITY_DN11019_c0_g1_i2.p1  ORF type:complete len:1664 (-),score=325.03 TRINITY_DN11019_c0_g1_i2:136-5127(-)